jgi:hypothetical protein
MTAGYEVAQLKVLILKLKPSPPFSLVAAVGMDALIQFSEIFFHFVDRAFSA